MKKIFLLPLVLFCLASCSSGNNDVDGDDPETPVTTFKFNQITDGYATQTFKYDASGKITHYEYLEDDDYDSDYWSITYTYSSDKITSVGFVENHNATGTYYLNSDGRISSATIVKDNGDIENSTFKYDSNGYLTEMVSTNGTFNATIFDGNVSKIKYTNDKGTSFTNNITYSNITNVSGMYFWDLGFLIDDIFYNYTALMLQGYLGKATKDIPYSATGNDGFRCTMNNVVVNAQGAITSFSLNRNNDDDILNYGVSYR